MDLYPKWDFIDKQKKYQKQKERKELIKYIIIWLITGLILLFIFLGNVSI